jgi:hypothetical protein
VSFSFNTIPSHPLLDPVKRTNDKYADRVLRSRELEWTENHEVNGWDRERRSGKAGAEATSGQINADSPLKQGYNANFKAYVRSQR